MYPGSILIVTVLAAPASAPAPPDPGQAVGLYARGDYAAAAKMLESAYKAGQARIQDRLLLARAYTHLKRTAEALAVLKSVLETDAENPEANSLAGQLLHRQGRNAEALPYLQHAYRLRGDPATAAVLGRCHYALGQVPQAKTHLAKALKQDIRDPTTSLLLGRICLEAGAGALAQKYLLMAQEAGLDSAQLHLLLGKAYLLQRKDVGPILARTIVAPVKPGQIVDAHVVIGSIGGLASRYKVCTRHSALYEGYWLCRRDPKHAEGLYMLAAGWLAAAEPARARKHLSALTSVEGKTARALRLEAGLLIAERDFAALDRCLTTALASKALGPPEAVKLYCRAALALRAEGSHDKAIATYAKAERLAPTSEQVLRALAGLYVVTGRGEQARRYYTRMVELFPDAADIDELRNSARVLQNNQGGQS